MPWDAMAPMIKRRGSNIGETQWKRRGHMLKAKTKIISGLAAVLLISIWMGIKSGPIQGIFFFFVLTVLLWAIAKTRRWI